MKTLDQLNHRFGRNKIRYAITDNPKPSWKTKSNFRSPRYTTDRKQLLTINI